MNIQAIPNTEPSQQQRQPRYFSGLGKDSKIGNLDLWWEDYLKDLLRPMDGRSDQEVLSRDADKAYRFVRLFKGDNSAFHAIALKWEIRVPKAAGVVLEALRLPGDCEIAWKFYTKLRNFCLDMQSKIPEAFAASPDVLLVMQHEIPPIQTNREPRGEFPAATREVLSKQGRRFRIASQLPSPERVANAPSQHASVYRSALQARVIDETWLLELAAWVVPQDGSILRRAGYSRLCEGVLAYPSVAEDISVYVLRGLLMDRQAPEAVTLLSGLLRADAKAITPLQLGGYYRDARASSSVVQATLEAQAHHSDKCELAHVVKETLIDRLLDGVRGGKNPITDPAAKALFDYLLGLDETVLDFKWLHEAHTRNRAKANITLVDGKEKIENKGRYFNFRKQVTDLIAVRLGLSTQHYSEWYDPDRPLPSTPQRRLALHA